MATTDDAAPLSIDRERFSDAVITAGLRELAGLRGSGDDLARVPKAAWDAWRDSALLPSSARLVQRYGSWNEACRRAGVPVVEQVVVSGPTQRWTDHQIAGWVARFLVDAETGSSYAAYTGWAQARPEAPAAQTVRNRFGGWSAACAAAAPAADPLPGAGT